MKGGLTKPWNSDRWKGYNDWEENTGKEKGPEMKYILAGADMWDDKKGQTKGDIFSAPDKGSRERH